MEVWNIVWRLFLLCLVPAAFSVGFYLLIKYTKFGKWPKKYQQLIIGIVFGGVAIFGTEVGVPINGAVANVRDAGPLCAGLIFGGPAGIIAGIIGGVERALQPVFENGTGAYSQVACSISTVLAGIYAWILRKFLFDDKRPSWGFGLASGIVMEVLHMSILFLTKLGGDINKAYEIIKVLSIPMIIANGIAVMIPCLIFEIIGKKENPKGKSLHKLTNQIQAWMLVTVVVVYVLTSTFTYFAQTQSELNNTDNLLQLNINDVVLTVDDTLKPTALDVSNKWKLTEDKQSLTSAKVQEWCDELEVDYIYIVEEETNPNQVKDGLVKHSNNASLENNYWMGSDPQSAEFNYLFDDFEQPSAKRITWYVQPILRDGQGENMKYAGIRYNATTYIQIAYTEAHFQDLVTERVEGLTESRHVGSTGRVFVATQMGQIISSIDENLQNKFLDKDIGFNYYTDPILQRFEKNIKLDGISNQSCYCEFTYADNYFYIVSAIPVEEINTRIINSLYFTSFMEIIVLASLFIIIYILIKKLVVNNIDEVNKDLAKIIDGDLSVKLKDKKIDEFSSLSKDINSTVDTLKHYIEEAAHRLDEELAFAKNIQMSALPNTYPAFPNNPQIDILARMFTAKEVGGDFYDYYLLDSKRIGFLIADVSGKGIPAAMFMMQSKATIKNFATQYTKTSEIIEFANEELCKENEAGMFVTCWFGIIELDTGVIRYTNAGHNPPLVYRNNMKRWEYLNGKCGFVLAGMDMSKYTQAEIKLEPGDKLFLYTDGVTEATRGDQVLYGEDRLLAYLTKHKDREIQETLDFLKVDIDKFIDGAPQFDDITMVMLEYRGKNAKKKDDK